MEVYYTRKERLEQTIGKMIVAIDVSKGDGTIGFADDRGALLEYKTYKYTDDMCGYLGLLDLVKKTKEKFRFSSAVFAMEPTGPYWKCLAYRLQQDGYLVCLVNQEFTQVATEMATGKPNKSDIEDLYGIAYMAASGVWYNCYIPESVYAEARVEWRVLEDLTEEVTRNKNRLHDWLGIYLKGYEDVWKSADGVFGEHSLVLLEKAHFPDQINELGVDGILALWKEAHLSQLKKRAREIVEIVTRNKDYSFSQGKAAAEIQVKGIISLLRESMRLENEMAEAAEKTVKTIGYLEPVLDIKGISFRTGVGIASALGDITRFQNAEQIISLAGTDPRVYMSGKFKGESHISKAGDGGLRAALYRVLTPLLNYNTAFRTIRDQYMHREENPLKKIQANVVVINKMIRVLFAVMTRHEKFDEEKMLGDIKRVNNPKISAAVIESEKLYKGIVEDLQKVKAVVPVEVSESIQKRSKALKGLVARAEKGSIIQGPSQVRGAMAGTAASAAAS